MSFFIYIVLKIYSYNMENSFVYKPKANCGLNDYANQYFNYR